MTKIFVEGIELWGKHGVEAFEHEQTQKFIIDIVMEAECELAETSDDIADTINYIPHTEVIREIVEKREFKLIERLASTIGHAILNNNKRVDRVTVTVKKPMIIPNGTPGVIVTLNR